MSGEQQQGWGQAARRAAVDVWQRAVRLSTAVQSMSGCRGEKSKSRQVIRDMGKAGSDRQSGTVGKRRSDRQMIGTVGKRSIMDSGGQTDR